MGRIIKSKVHDRFYLPLKTSYCSLNFTNKLCCSSIGVDLNFKGGRSCIVVALTNEKNFSTNRPFKYSQEFLSYFISTWLSNVSITLRCLSKPRIFSTDLIPQFSLRSFFIASVTQILRCENRPKNFSYLKGLFIKSICVVYSSISIIIFL